MTQANGQLTQGNGNYELRCNGLTIGTVDTFDKAVAWLDKMEETDTEQEFTWSFTKGPYAVTKDIPA